MLTAVLLTVLIVFVISMLVFAPIFGLGSSGSSVICPGVTNTGYKFEDRAELLAGIEEWVTNKETTKNKYGDINTWDVTAVTDMSGMFGTATRSVFNDNIGCWDVSKVTNMESMFLNQLEEGSPFNKPIGKWDVSSVTNMNSMFSRASNFNQDISSWDVSNVTNMNSMFLGADAFNQNLSNWKPNIETTLGYQDMFRDSGLSGENGDWRSNPTFKNNVENKVGETQTINGFYTNGEAYVTGDPTPLNAFPKLE